MRNKLLLIFGLVMLLLSLNLKAQVGINTTDPDVSSALDIESTDSGLLIPRMSTTERDNIVDPAHSLLIYDTELDGYYFNEGTTDVPDWSRLLTGSKTRDNHVIVKSVSDFPVASGGTITLDTNTLYEINGTITTSNSINVNGAYVIGEDTNEDIINYTGSGSLFVGSANASFRNVTFNNSSTGTLFNLSASASNTLIAQSVVVNGFSSVGSVSNYGLVFFNVIQFLNNSTGITYSGIENLLLNNMGWVASNSGVYETFTGSFGFIQKVSGFSIVPSGATGIDVSTNPILDNGTLKGVVFNGDGDFIAPYTGAGTYIGFNFTNDWEVDCAGIPRESDNNASGNIYIERNSTTTNPSFSIAPAAAIDASIIPGQMFRFSNASPNTSSSNVLEYEGKESRTFSVNGNLAYKPTSVGGATVYAFYIQRFNSSGSSQGVPLGTEVYSEVSSGSTGGGDFLVRAIPLNGKVKLDPGDYVRIYGQVISSSGTARDNIKIYSVSLTLD